MPEEYFEYKNIDDYIQSGWKSCLDKFKHLKIDKIQINVNQCLYIPPDWKYQIYWGSRRKLIKYSLTGPSNYKKYL